MIFIYWRNAEIKLQDNLITVGEAAGLTININKTKAMVCSRDDIGQHRVVGSSEPVNVTVCVSGQFAAK